MANRSDKFYFPRGDLVLQVGNTLFRLHQDILATHSGFFDDMLSTPTSDNTEGTEANPLRVPTCLCSDRAFAVLCRLLYPSKMGSRFSIIIKQLDMWEEVLRATVALQMDDTRRFILKRLDEDTPNIKRNTVKLLRVSLEYEETPASLLAACLRILGHRCKRLTPDEARTLGEEGACLVNDARERIRAVLSSFLVRVLGEEWTGPLSSHARCITDAFTNMLNAPVGPRIQETDDTHDIFQGHVSCSSCAPAWERMVPSFRTLSAQVVDEIVKEARPTLKTRS